MPTDVSATLRMRSIGQSLSCVPPAATTPRIASCNPVLLPLRLRSSTSASKQNIAPPQYLRPQLVVPSRPPSVGFASPAAYHGRTRAKSWPRSNGRPARELSARCKPRDPPPARDGLALHREARGGSSHARPSNLLADRPPYFRRQRRAELPDHDSRMRFRRELHGPTSGRLERESRGLEIGRSRRRPPWRTSRSTPAIDCSLGQTRPGRTRQKGFRRRP